MIQNKASLIHWYFNEYFINIKSNDIGINRTICTSSGWIIFNIHRGLMYHINNNNIVCIGIIIKLLNVLFFYVFIKIQIHMILSLFVCDVKPLWILKIILPENVHMVRFMQTTLYFILIKYSLKYQWINHASF